MINLTAIAIGDEGINLSLLHKIKIDRQILRIATEYFAHSSKNIICV